MPVRIAGRHGYLNKYENKSTLPPTFKPIDRTAIFDAPNMTVYSIMQKVC